MKEEFLVCSLAHDNGVSLKVHDAIGCGVVHLPIVEELVMLQNTISLLPCPDTMSLLVQETMAVWLSDAESTQTDIMSSV